jgi:hypothetical protein
MDYQFWLKNKYFAACALEWTTFQTKIIGPQKHYLFYTLYSFQENAVNKNLW